MNRIGGTNLEFMQLDLNDLASVKQFAENFKGKYDRLDILVNNAGIMALPKRETTAQGLEKQSGVNHFGHFLLTKLLIPCLQNAKNTYRSNEYKDEAGRIVNLSSVTHHFAPSNERTHPNGDGSSDLSANNGIHDKQFWLGSA